MFKVVNTVKLLREYFIFNLKACMEYRAAFIGQFFAVFINNGTFLIFWYLVYGKVDGDINGYVFDDVTLLWGVIAASFGLSEVLFGNSNRLSSIIYKGELDTYILQPKPILPNIVCSRMVMLGWGDILYGLFIMLFSFGLDPVRIPLFLLFSFTGALVFTAFRILIHSLTFFIGNNEVLSMTLENIIITLGVYPASIFRGAIMILLYTILPVTFMVYIPVEILNVFNLKSLLFVLFGDTLFILVSLFIFYSGLKRYESGNMIGTRL